MYKITSDNLANRMLQIISSRNSDIFRIGKLVVSSAIYSAKYIIQNFLVIYPEKSCTLYEGILFNVKDKLLFTFMSVFCILII